MSWMPSPAQQELYTNQYLIDELRNRSFLDFSEREMLKRRLERVKELEEEIAESKEKDRKSI